MAEDEAVKSGVDKAKTTLAQAEAKLRAATNAAERVEAQKLVRMAQDALAQAEATLKAAEAKSAAAVSAATERVQVPAVEARKHVVKKGESLSLIAKQYYGDVHRWKELYEANKTVVGDNPDLIQPGMELVIP
jgi:nucleoid-associated protein YgaU